MRISDWSSDVCSSDLEVHHSLLKIRFHRHRRWNAAVINRRIHEPGSPGAPEWLFLIRENRHALFAPGHRPDALITIDRHGVKHHQFTLQGFEIPMQGASSSPDVVPVGGPVTIEPRSEERRVGKEWVSPFKSR